MTLPNEYLLYLKICNGRTSLVAFILNKIEISNLICIDWTVHKVSVIAIFLQVVFLGDTPASYIPVPPLRSRQPIPLPDELDWRLPVDTWDREYRRFRFNSTRVQRKLNCISLHCVVEIFTLSYDAFFYFSCYSLYIFDEWFDTESVSD